MTRHRLRGFLGSIENHKKPIKGGSHTFKGVEVTAYHIPVSHPESSPVLKLANDLGHPVCERFIGRDRGVAVI